MGNRLVVEGSPEAVSAFIDQALAVTERIGGRSRRVAFDVGSAGVTVFAFRKTHREYVEFSPLAMERLRQYGPIAAEDGYFRSIVHNGKTLAGNLDWRRVDLGPEQALNMQVAAAQLALRAAIKEVVTAIERVEGKVDTLIQLVEAERLGTVVGDRGTLQPLVDRVRSTGQISRTDWATVASLGPLIARDIEALRAYITRQIKDVDDGTWVRVRAGEAERLTERLIRESVALLVVAEQNDTLWQELRLAHATTHELSASGAMTSDIREQLGALERSDQQLVEALQNVSDRLATPTGYEGFAPLKKRDLRNGVEALDELCEWFRDQRHLDGAAGERPKYAQSVESVNKAREAITGAARASKNSLTENAIGLTKRRQGGKTGSDDEAELSS